MSNEKINKKKGINFKVGDTVFYIPTHTRGSIKEHLGDEIYIVQLKDKEIQAKNTKLVKF